MSPAISMWEYDWEVLTHRRSTRLDVEMCPSEEGLLYRHPTRSWSEPGRSIVSQSCSLKLHSKNWILEAWIPETTKMQFPLLPLLPRHWSSELKFR